MKVTTLRIDKSRVVMEVEVDQETVDASMEKAFRRLSNRVNIPGFRKGKAPRPMIERMLGRGAILEEALDRMVPDVYNRLIEEHEVEAVAQPEIEVTQLEPVVFKATIPVRPTVVLGDYRAVRVEYEEPEVTEQQIQATLDQLRDSQAWWEPVDRPVRMDDLATLDIEGDVGGQPFSKLEDVDYHCIAKSDVPVPGFAEMLEGTPADTEREFELDLPEDYRRSEVAGKTSHFKVLVKSVKEKRLPELDDDFARSLDRGLDSLEELRQRVVDSLEAQAETNAMSALEQRLIDRVIETAAIDLPDVMVDREVDHLVEEQKQALKRESMELEQYLEMINKSEDELRAEFAPTAELRVKRSLVLSEVIKAEHLEVSDEAVEAEIEEQLAGRPEEQQGSLRSFYASEYVRDMLRRNRLTQNVVDFLVETATEGAVNPAEVRARRMAETRQVIARQRADVEGDKNDAPAEQQAPEQEPGAEVARDTERQGAEATEVSTTDRN